MSITSIQRNDKERNGENKATWTILEIENTKLIKNLLSEILTNHWYNSQVNAEVWSRKILSWIKNGEKWILMATVKIDQTKEKETKFEIEIKNERELRWL